MDVITLSSVHVEVSYIAAGLWATVGVGLAVGSGLYFLGISATLLILLIQILVHRKGKMSHYTEAGHIEVNLTKTI